MLDYTHVDVVWQISALLGTHESAALILDCVGSSKGSLAPIAKVAKKGATIAVLLPVIVKDSSDIDAPEYSFNAGVAAPWAEGVLVRGVRTHFYPEVCTASLWFCEGLITVLAGRTSSTNTTCNQSSCPSY